MSAAEWGIAVVYAILLGWSIVLIASAVFWFVKRGEPEMQYHGTEEDVTPIYRAAGRTRAKPYTHRKPAA